jgi:hypothetical protein
MRSSAHNWGLARCQTCHNFVLVVSLLEPVVQVRVVCLQMQLGEYPVAAGSKSDAFPGGIQRQQDTSNGLEFALFAKDPQDFCEIPSLKGCQFFPAHGGIKNANLVQVNTTGMFTRSKATQTRWGFHGGGSKTGGLWYSSLQAVNHGGNDRIRKSFSSQQALKIGQGNRRPVHKKMLIDTVIHNAPRKVLVI